MQMKLCPEAMNECTQSGTLNHADVYLTGLSVRYAARTNTYASFTSGLAPSFIQANLIVVPSRYAADFRLLCQRNPVPCPLLVESESVGKWDKLVSRVDGFPGGSVAADLDIRRDAPRYMVYKDGLLVRSQITDVMEEWTEDHVAFVIGCSYSFESALVHAGLPPRHVVMGRNVSM
jgi:uncharacterized protein YcsI (UPF0317 family)